VATAPTREAVVIVHGTYANPGYPAYPAASNWWAPSGTFGKALDTALQRHGSPARCEWGGDFLRGGGPYNPYRTRWHGWSGANSEVDRRRGAFELAEFLRDLQADDSVARIHIVAHSHGGNVVRRALRYLNHPGHKLGQVVCLGTPFLHFGDGAAWRRWLARVHWPMAVVLVAILAALPLAEVWFKRPADQWSSYLVIVAAIAAIVSMWRFARRTEASSFDVPMTALRFANDEAIQLLRACAALAATPHLFLRTQLGGPAARTPRRGPGTGRLPYDGWFDKLSHVAEGAWRWCTHRFAELADAWNGPLCRAAEWLTTRAFRVWIVGTLLGSLCTLGLIMAFRPYRPPLRPFFSSRVPRLRDLFFHSIDESMQPLRDEITKRPWPTLTEGGVLTRGTLSSTTPPAPSWLDTATSAWKTTGFHPDTLQPVVAVAPVLLYALCFYPLDKLLGLPAWLGAVMTRFVILLGARAAAGAATGMDILGAAFQPRRTGEPPARVTELTLPASIEQALEQRLDAAMRLNLAPLRAALDPARKAMLLEAVQQVFIDPAMLHCQYTEETQVIDGIARLIAGEALADVVGGLAANPGD
jgi:Alpha/beta hydrolase of unknown function (DUF900)